MLPRLNFLVLLLLPFFDTVAQKCDCLKEFKFVQEYMEKNHPGLNSGTMNSKEYKKGVKDIIKEIRKAKPGNDCNLYINEFLLLVKDHHTSIGIVMPEVKRFDTKSSSALDSFYNSPSFSSALKRSVDTTTIISRLKKANGKIEGLYKDRSGNFIAFVKEPGKWNYKGITVRSTTPIYPVGTIRYELKERPE